VTAKSRRKHASGKESDSIRAARIAQWGTIIAALIGLIGVVLGLVLKPGNGASGNQLQSGAPSSSQPSSRHPSAVIGSIGTSPSASASASASDPAETGPVSIAAPEHKWMYQSNQLVLDDNGCDNHYIYPYALFGPNSLTVNPDSPSPPSRAFGVVLMCSATTSGSGFDPNLAYGGTAAILPGGADFNSCYSKIVNSPFRGSIPFGNLRRGIHLCILHDTRLALVTLLSVSQTEYRLTGTVTVWQVLTSN
jgi:hypothetical protein